MRKVAVFPGSFDPITLGHLDIVQRAIPLFDEIIVAIGINNKKSSLFTLDQRLAWINEIFKTEDKVSTGHYEGLTIDFCKKSKANYLLRGIRSAADFEYEKTIAHLNLAMEGNIETILMLAKPELSSISSTIVREIISAGGNAEMFLPPEVQL